MKKAKISDKKKKLLKFLESRSGLEKIKDPDLIANICICMEQNERQI